MAGGEGTQPGGVDYPDHEWEKHPIEDPLDQVEAAQAAEGAGREVPQKSPRVSGDEPNRPWDNEPTDDELHEGEP